MAIISQTRRYCNLRTSIKEKGDCILSREYSKIFFSEEFLVHTKNKIFWNVHFSQERPRDKEYVRISLKHTFTSRSTKIKAAKYRYFAAFRAVKTANLVRVARLELAASWSQTRRPTNWATPGYEVKEKIAKWSNMWSRKFYHIFAELSTEVIRGNCGVTGEYATFREVEPFWCSSSQSRRATNCATPGFCCILFQSAS